MATMQPASPPAPTATQDYARASRSSVNSDDAPTMRAGGKLANLLQNLQYEIPVGTAGRPCKTRNFRYPPPGNEDGAWGECSHHIDAHDEDLCRAFLEQIDTLLVFLGLFSAIVTAFSIESYKWLSVSPPDPNTVLLTQVVLLLSANVTGIAMPEPSAPTLKGAVAARINVYWFLSLTLSLSSALIGILCKQWVREFRHQPRTTGPELVGVRQTKYEGFQAWWVREIVSVLPLILQVALGLFVLGVLELLWRLHTIVAAVVTAAASITLLFYLATTFLPAIQHVLVFSPRTVLPNAWRLQCPYKSPQSLIVLRMMRAVFIRPSATDAGSAALSDTESQHSQAQSRADSHPFDSWILFDREYDTARNAALPADAPKSHWRGLGWLLETTSHAGLRQHVWHCLWANALRHSEQAHVMRHPNPSVVRGSPGPWHVLKSDPRTEYIINTVLEPKEFFASQTWWGATMMYCAEASFSEATRLEIFIRGLTCWPTTEPLAAYHVLDIILPDDALKESKLQNLSGSLVRCAAIFFDRNSKRPTVGLGYFLRKVANCLAGDRSGSADTLLACICILYARWFRSLGYNANGGVTINNSLMVDLVFKRAKRRARRIPDPLDRDRLRAIPHIHEFAELLMLATMKYWDVRQDATVAIDWSIFPPMFGRGLRDDETLFRHLVSFAMEGRSHMPRAISVPITEAEINRVDWLLRNTPFWPGSGGSVEDIQPATARAQSPRDQHTQGHGADAQDEQRGSSALLLIGNDPRGGHPASTTAHAPVDVAEQHGPATIAPTTQGRVTVPRAVTGTHWQGGPESIRPLRAASRSPTGDVSPLLARAVLRSRSNSLPTRFPVARGSSGSGTPISRGAGSGGSRASVLSSPSGVGSPSGRESPRAVTPRRQGTAEGPGRESSRVSRPTGLREASRDH